MARTPRKKWNGRLAALAAVGLCATLANGSPPPGRDVQTPASRTTGVNVGDLPMPSTFKAGGDAQKLPSGDGAYPPGTVFLPLDLPTALQLANAANPTIALARARVAEAYARLRQAKVLWLPDLTAGPSYYRHDGLLQDTTGNIIPVNKWNFFAGGGATASVETSAALFAPLIASRLVEAQSAAARGVTYDIQLQVAIAYLDLLSTYGALAVNAESLTNALEILRLAEAAERNGLGRTPADANRARTEVEQRRQERTRLEGDVGARSARLTQLLLLNPSTHLQPAEQSVLPVALVPLEAPVDELVAAGLMNRPELAESRSLVAASLARWKQSRVAPLLPRLEASYLAGDFGGGIDDNTQRFGGRGDGTAQALWTLHNFGAGDVARAQAARAQYSQANYHVMEIQAQVGAEVSSAANIALSRERALEDAQKGVQQAEEMWRRLRKWTVEVGFRAQQYEAVELLLAEQALNQARLTYLGEVIEFNQAEFRLYWAMGQPPMSAIPQATTRSVAVSVLPPSPGAAQKGAGH